MMKLHLSQKISSLIVSTLCATGFVVGVSQPSQAQTFPGIQFGCSAPSANLQEIVRGLGNSSNNALIATPTNNREPFPIRADIAIFGGYDLADNGGFFSGQLRCAEVARRLNAFNGAYNTQVNGDFVFGVTYAAGVNPVVCLQPVGMSNCPNMVNVPIQGGGTLSNNNSYVIVPIANTSNKGAFADRFIGNVGASFFGAAANSRPAIDM